MRILLFLLLLPCIATAQELANDKIRWVDYSESNVVQVNTQRGFATQIVLDASESIETTVGGDSDGWDVIAKTGAHQIFLKPRLNALNSNLIVTGKRNYVFALNVLTTRDKSDWQIVFRYPVDEVATPLITTSELMTRTDSGINRLLNANNQLVNCNYTMQIESESEDIRPNNTCDDGRFTYITISNNREMPAVFRINPDGTESIVNKHIEGRDTIVMHEVAKRWVLRLSKQVVGIWNEAFDPEGNAPIDGVSKVGVARELKKKIGANNGKN